MMEVMCFFRVMLFFWLVFDFLDLGVWVFMLDVVGLLLLFDICFDLFCIKLYKV